MRTRSERHPSATFTAHRITPEQWTEANALAAVMLAVGLLRELDFWLHLSKEHAQAQSHNP